MTRKELESHLPPGIYLVLDTEVRTVSKGHTYMLHEWHGKDIWLFQKHPDGQWVSIRKATPEDVTTISNARQR